MVVASRFSLHVSPYGPLRPNVTSSIKPEVHNISQRRQRRTEPRHRESAHRISVTGPSSFWTRTGQTGRRWAWASV